MQGTGSRAREIKEENIMNKIFLSIAIIVLFVVPAFAQDDAELEK